MHYPLLYDLVEDHMERRSTDRALHLAHARATVVGNRATVRDPAAGG